MSERYEDVKRRDQAEALRWAAREVAWERVLDSVRRNEPPPVEESVPSAPALAAAPRRPGRALRLLFRGAHVVTIAAVLATNLFLLTHRGTTTEVSLDEAIAGFRGSAVAQVQSRRARELRVPSPPRQPVRSTALAELAAPAGRAPTIVRPTEGVYTYRTTGGERISFGGGHHDYPDRTYATVTLRRACGWSFEHRIIAEHTEDRRFCSGPGRVALVTETVMVSFFGHSDGGTYRCRPPLPFGDGDRETGSTARFVCSSDDARVDSTVRFLAPQTIRVGDERVRALHVTIDGVVSGRATGTSHSEIWVDPVSGLLLQLRRTVHSESDAFGTTVSYDEEASFTLASLRPRV